MGQPWVTVFLFRPPLFLCKWMCCIPQSLHLPEKWEPQHVPRLRAHTPCVSTTGSKPCHHGRVGPAAPDPAKAVPSQFCSVGHVANVFTSLSWFHVTGTRGATGSHMLPVNKHTSEIFLRGKDIEVTLLLNSFTLFYVKPCRYTKALHCISPWVLQIVFCYKNLLNKDN